MEDEIIKKAIQIKAIETDDKKITILEELQGKQKYSTKYSFFKKKANSEEETRAYEQFKEMEIEAGKVYAIGYVDNQGKNPHTGGETTYHNIRFFSNDTNVPQQAQNTAQVNTEPSGAILEVNKRLDGASQAFKELSNQLKGLEMRVGVLEMEDGSLDMKDIGLNM